MFDVIWTDPNIEHVGQRKQRKEKEAKEKEKKKAGPSRQSVSTNSSAASSERGFSLFGSRKKTPAPSGERATLNAIAKDDAGSSRAQTSSAYGVNAALAPTSEAETPPQPTEGPFLPVQPPGLEETFPRSTRDSALSKWAQHAAIETGAFEKIAAYGTVPATKVETHVQRLGPSSYITQVVETTFSPRTTEGDSDQTVVETHISSDAIKAQSPPRGLCSEDAASETRDELESFPPPYEDSHTPPPIERRNTQISSTPKYDGHDRLGSSEAWKPPHEWNCTPTRQTPSATIDERLQMSASSSKTKNSMFPCLSILKRELRMMAAASPELTLANMKSSMGEATDAMVYKELEMTKKRWMFTALHKQSGYAELIDQTSERKGDPTAPKQKKSLALYETQASASFLAALHPKLAITHLSPTPLSPSLFPNVQPLLVPSISVAASSLALPPQLYSTVTCLSMPTLFPSTDIPPFLSHINRCLAPGGALHLTIIDPQPVSATMGPKLRQWLFSHLLINLEQAFRTTWPSETFPAWLAAANLRGKGSTIATIVIPAVSEASGSDPMEVRAELRCLVTRQLWQEVWGAFVHAPRWWWEEEAIVQECIELDTHWQYAHIVAVKEAEG